MSQFAISSPQHGGRRRPPLVFTEHGAIMAANVLNSKEAARMSVFVVRAFVQLGAILATHKELANKLSELEHKVGTHDQAIVSIIATIRQLTEPAKPKALDGCFVICRVRMQVNRGVLGRTDDHNS